MLYESYSQPLTILSTLPSAGVGALLALMATGTEFSLIAFLGILLLIGIVKKNAIMMVDFALDAERTLGLDPRAAIARACALRFRPIMMTTCAAIAGALPLAIAYGDGTEMRRPLGISIVGGLIVSQLLTLYTTPVVYLYVHRYWKRLQAGAATRRRASGHATGAPACDPAGRRLMRMLVALLAPALRALIAACAVGPGLQAAGVRRRAEATRRGRLEAQRTERRAEPRALVEHLQRRRAGPARGKIDISNQNVKAAAAAYDQASALVGAGAGRLLADASARDAVRGAAAAAAGPAPATAAPRVTRATSTVTQQRRARPTGRSISGARSAAPSRATGRRPRRAPRRLPPPACRRRPRSPPIISSCARRISCKSCWTTPSSPSSSR